MSGAPSRQIACSSCGAILEYDPDAAEASLTCRSCGARQPIRVTAAEPKSEYRALLAAALEAGHFVEQGVLDCGTCGAQTTLAASVIADRCPFCGKPSVTPAHSRLLRPAAVLPFALDEKQARAQVNAWQRGLWFRPARLGPPAGDWRMSAVYLPYWSFDWEVTTDYRGDRGTKVDKETKWTPASGTVRTRLDGATVFGSRSLGREQGAELEPWDTAKVVGYQDEYLLGVRAETSAIGVPEAGDLAHRVLERQVIYEIECAIGGENQRIHEKTIRYHAASVQLLLMPVWVTHFEHGGRSYRVLVNARSGEVIGERPVSRARMWSAALAPLLLALVGAAVLPGLLDWHPREAWRAHLASFWGVLTAFGLGAFVVGSVMNARAKGKGPRRHGQLFVSRPGPGTSGLQVDPAAIWQGTLQDDGESQGALVQMLGFCTLFVALFPFLSTAAFDDSLLPVVMMHGFGALALGAFVWATRVARSDRRKLLGAE